MLDDGTIAAGEMTGKTLEAERAMLLSLFGSPAFTGTKLARLLSIERELTARAAVRDVDAAVIGMITAEIDAWAEHDDANADRASAFRQANAVVRKHWRPGQDAVAVTTNTSSSSHRVGLDNVMV